MLLSVPARRARWDGQEMQFRRAASSARHPHTTFDGLRRPGVVEGSSDNLLARFRPTASTRRPVFFESGSTSFPDPGPPIPVP
jgi:hypothetical protein